MQAPIRWALLAWAMVFAPAMAAAQDKRQSQKASSAPQAQPAPVAKPSAEKQDGAAKSERSGGPQEGIKVHGHWVIEVRNSDGTRANHVEFENALDPSGHYLLAHSLVGGGPPVLWSLLVGSSSVQLCPSTNPVSPTWLGACVITAPSSAGPAFNAPGIFKNLSVNATGDLAVGSGADSTFILKGSATAEAGGTIDTVRSVFVGSQYFSSKTLAPAEQSYHNRPKLVARLRKPHKHWVFCLWRRGGIATVVVDEEVRIGERWFVSCFQRRLSIRRNRQCLCGS
jgi:hypothetical protein